MSDQRRRARIGFAILCLAVPVQFAVKEGASEPYPGLFMPEFGSVPAQPGRFSQTAPQITVAFSDGRRERLAPSDLLAESDSTPKVAIYAIFRTNLDPTDPGTISWVRGRVLKAFPNRDPKTVYITWTRSTYAVSNRALLSRDRLQTYRIEVG